MTDLPHPPSLRVMGQPPAGVLETVGLGGADEHVYRLLVDYPGIDTIALSARTGLPVRGVRRCLDTLTSAGLISRTSGRRGRHVVIAPDVALEMLLLRRQEDFARVRLLAAELAERVRRTAQERDVTELVEVVIGLDALRQRSRHLHRAATRELLLLDQPPYAAPEPGTPSQDELDCLKRGVEVRVVYDQQALAVPGILEAHIRPMIQAGEQARTSSGLPLKLVVAPGSAGLIPLQSRGAQINAAVVVNPSPLLDALVALFNMIWERALPLHDGAAKEVAAAGSVISALEQSILQMMCVGLKDEAIARQLNIGQSTVERHIRKMLNVAGVQSRFQLALSAVQQRWLSITSPTLD